MAGAFVQHPANMGRQRHLAHQGARENFLALIKFAVGKTPAHMGELDVAAFDIGQPQKLHGLGDGEQFVHFQFLLISDVGQVGLAVIGRRRQGLDQAGNLVGRDMHQRQGDAGGARRLGLAHPLHPPGRHFHVNLIDIILEFRRGAVARLRQVDGDFRTDPAGIGREQQHPVAHQDRFLDIVGDQDDALDRQFAVAPQLDQVGAQIFRGQNVERAERLVHQQNIGMHHHGAGEADALAHAAGQFARIGAFITVKPDQIDGGKRPCADFGLGQAQCLKPQFHILQHRQPGKQGKALKYHGDALGRAFDGGAHIMQIAALRPRQAGDQA